MVAEGQEGGLWKNWGHKRVKDFGGCDMYLPLERADEWHLRIFQDPILFETRDLISLLKKHLSEAAFLAFTYYT